MNLPTQQEMILNTISALDEARAKLSDARDWMQSDWQPIDSPLPHAAAEARISTLSTDQQRACSTRSTTSSMVRWRVIIGDHV